MSAPAPSHARSGAPPASMTSALTPLREVDRIAMPAVDVDRYLREDDEAAMAGPGGPARFAAPIAVDLSSARDGTWERLPDGSRVWRLRILSPGALSLNFGFGVFRLPPGATVHLYPSPEGLPAAAGIAPYSGPYTNHDTDHEGGFWTAVIPGDESVVEMFVPPDPLIGPELRIHQVAHDYRGFAQLVRAASKQGDCNIDVVCPEGDPWRSEIRSVAVYSRNGTMACTGTLINSHDPEEPPYFLTAYHCGVTAQNARTMVVYWNYESPVCGALSGGSLDQHQTGADFVARYVATDFCLVRLSQDPDTSVNAHYSGWDARPDTAPQEAVAIHHPQCDEKAISFTHTPLSVTSYLQNSVPGDSTHWRVHFWDAGTTEPGSSGSGLWNPDRRLIGQLHGGYASCTSLTSDWYGRLSRSWDGGGTAATRLRDWLDPRGTGVRVIDGRDASGPGGGLAGDANLDGVVDVHDIVVIVNHILGVAGLPQGGFANADIDRDGEITVLDLVLVINIILDAPAPFAGLRHCGNPYCGRMPRDEAGSADVPCWHSGSLPVHVSLASGSDSGGPGLVISGRNDLAAIQVHLHPGHSPSQRGGSAAGSTLAVIEGLEGSGWNGLAGLGSCGSVSVVLYTLDRTHGGIPGVVQIPFGLDPGGLVWGGAKAASAAGDRLAVTPSGFGRDPHDGDGHEGARLHPVVHGIGPNPFRDALAVHLHMPSPGRVQIQVYDVTGRLRAVHSTGILQAGESRVDWRACPEALEDPGVYFIRVGWEGRTVDRRSVVLIR